MTQAVILAGGKGTRLRERLGPLPKPLVDVGGVPLLERQLLLAKSYGIAEILILVNYAADSIVNFCATNDNWGLNIACIDDGRPRGTAGATLAAFEKLADEFLVMYGDTMLCVDLGRFFAYHSEVQRTGGTLFVHPNDHPQDSDLVEMTDDGYIEGFYPYPHDKARFYPNLVSAALYWVRKEALSPWRDFEGQLDFCKDLFPAMLRQGISLRGYRSAEYIKDVGTPERLDRVCAELKSGRIPSAGGAESPPIVFLDRDGTINREVDHLNDPAQFELLPGVVESIRRLNRANYRCCVVTNQPVIARGECTLAQLRQVHNKMETLLGSGGAYVDRIYYCPHHPQSGFPGERAELKCDCSCRKPGTGMIEQALAEFRASNRGSWLVGDSSVDVETARRAKLRSVLVETGYAGLDCREWATPDAIVPNLAAAVTYIMDLYPRLRAWCDEIADEVAPGGLVVIGGLARSGKSTFAHVLRDALGERGKPAVVLALDRWLKGEEAREPGVLGRYDMIAIQSLYESLEDPHRRPAEITLPGYRKLERVRIPNVEKIELSSAQVVIIEGVVALTPRQKESAPGRRYYIEIAEELRMPRVVREYRLRGYSEAEANRVYHNRQVDEVPVVESSAVGAVRVSMTELFR